jgi:hypothetical protein
MSSVLGCGFLESKSASTIIPAAKSPATIHGNRLGFVLTLAGWTRDFVTDPAGAMRLAVLRPLSRLNRRRSLAISRAL